VSGKWSCVIHGYLLLDNIYLITLYFPSA